MADSDKPQSAPPAPAASPAPAATPPATPPPPAARDVAAIIRERFPQAVHDGEGPRGDGYCWVKREAVFDVIRTLRDELGFNVLMDETCVDYPERTPRFEMIYNMYAMESHERFFVKALTDDSEPGMPSLVPLFKCANWFEREVYDMFGVRFAGHPDLRRILMYDAFKGYPLRKDYDARHRQHIVPVTSDPTARNG